MPEGPETRNIADEVNRLLKLNDNSRKKIDINGLITISETLIGKLYTVGKVIVLDLENAQLLFGMGMTGSLMVDGNHDQVRLTINIENNKVHFRDPRKFGTVKIKQFNKMEWTKCPEKCLGLAPSWIDKQEKHQLDAIIQSAINYHSKRAIHNVLLDQRAVLSGVGNIYASEACFHSELDPRSSWNSLTIKDKKRLMNAAIDIMVRSMKNGGSSVKSYTASGKKGNFQNMLYVYGKEGNILKRNNKKYIVKKTKISNRSVFYVSPLDNE